MGTSRTRAAAEGMRAASIVVITSGPAEAVVAGCKFFMRVAVPGWIAE